MTPLRIRLSGETTLLQDERYVVLDSDPPSGKSVRLQLKADTPLPFVAGTVDMVVVTETLEFLDPGTIFGLLLDIHRVMRVDGRLLIDIPDFVGLLADWDGARTLGQFCTYRRPTDTLGVSRTPTVDATTLEKLRRSESPMRLAIDLANLAIDTEPACRFGRQSAWSPDELATMLWTVGFEVLSFDGDMTEQLSDGLLALGSRGRLRCIVAPISAGHLTGDSSASSISDEAAGRFRSGIASARAGRYEEALQLLKDAIDGSPTLGERQYRLVWDLYVRALRATIGTDVTPSATFALEGRDIGRVDEKIVQSVRRELSRAPVVAVSAADAARGYLSNPNLTPDAEAAINRDNVYLALEAPTLTAAGPLFEALADTVEACLGTPFRIVNVRAWRTHSKARRVEANGWHRDEPYPAVILKVIVYLTAAGPETGSTEVVHTDGTHSFSSGPAGTFLAFQNSELVHRGTPPVKGTREILEVTVTPHPVRDLRPVCAGQNADFPISPWLPLDRWMVLEHSTSS